MGLSIKRLFNTFIFHQNYTVGCLTHSSQCTQPHKADNHHAWTKERGQLRVTVTQAKPGKLFISNPLHIPVECAISWTCPTILQSESIATMDGNREKQWQRLYTLRELKGKCIEHLTHTPQIAKELPCMTITTLMTLLILFNTYIKNKYFYFLKTFNHQLLSSNCIYVLIKDQSRK